jgi:tyrosine-protein kinase Etk/Wzc
MSITGESHALSPRASRSPIIGVPFDPRVVDAPREEPAFDLKGYLNTL